MSCRCMNCARRYRIDFMVPQEDWDAIRPAGRTGEGGTLCGSCIAARLEELGDYGSFELRRRA